jgi:hypothetical protein
MKRPLAMLANIYFFMNEALRVYEWNDANAALADLYLMKHTCLTAPSLCSTTSCSEMI